MDPFTLSIIAGGLGSGLSILGARRQREIIERQKQYAIQAARLRGDQLTARLGRESARAQGTLSVNQADRNVFGRSAARAKLSLMSEALSEQAAINLNEFIQIGEITANANAQKPDLLSAGLSGFSSGAQLGASISSLTPQRSIQNFGLLGNSNSRALSVGFVNRGPNFGLPIPQVF